MASDTAAQASALPDDAEGLWFLGNYVRIKLDARHTAGRLGVFEALLPHGASPPLHSHPQDETFWVLDGEITVWVVEPELAEDRPAWIAQRAQRCGVGAIVCAPAGMPHTFRIESGTARLLTLSTPAGIEEFVRALAEPALWPWLPPPPDGPRVAPERLEAVERQFGMVRHGPPPPAA